MEEFGGDILSAGAHPGGTDILPSDAFVAQDILPPYAVHIPPPPAVVSSSGDFPPYAARPPTGVGGLPPTPTLRVQQPPRLAVAAAPGMRVLRRTDNPKITIPPPPVLAKCPRPTPNEGGQGAASGGSECDESTRGDLPPPPPRLQTPITLAMEVGTDDLAPTDLGPGGVEAVVLRKGADPPMGFELDADMRLSAVLPGSPAASAGLVRLLGMYLVQVNGLPVVTFADLPIVFHTALGLLLGFSPAPLQLSEDGTEVIPNGTQAAASAKLAVVPATVPVEENAMLEQSCQALVPEPLPFMPPPVPPPDVLVPTVEDIPDAAQGALVPVPPGQQLLQDDKSSDDDGRAPGASLRFDPAQHVPHPDWQKMTPEEHQEWLRNKGRPSAPHGKGPGWTPQPPPSVHPDTGLYFDPDRERGTAPGGSTCLSVGKERGRSKSPEGRLVVAVQREVAKARQSDPDSDDDAAAGAEGGAAEGRVVVSAPVSTLRILSPRKSQPEADKGHVPKPPLPPPVPYHKRPKRAPLSEWEVHRLIHNFRARHTLRDDLKPMLLGLDSDGLRSVLRPLLDPGRDPSTVLIARINLEKQRMEREKAAKDAGQDLVEAVPELPVVCPDGHLVIPFSPTTEWVCSQCHLKFRAGVQWFYGCGKCDWDLCPRCVASRTASVAAVVASLMLAGKAIEALTQALAAARERGLLKPTGPSAADLEASREAAAKKAKKAFEGVEVELGGVWHCECAAAHSPPGRTFKLRVDASHQPMHHGIINLRGWMQGRRRKTTVNGTYDIGSAEITLSIHYNTGKVQRSELCLVVTGGSPVGIEGKLSNKPSDSWTRVTCSVKPAKSSAISVSSGDENPTPASQPPAENGGDWSARVRPQQTELRQPKAPKDKAKGKMPKVPKEPKPKKPKGEKKAKGEKKGKDGKKRSSRSVSSSRSSRRSLSRPRRRSGSWRRSRSRTSWRRSRPRSRARRRRRSSSSRRRSASSDRGRRRSDSWRRRRPSERRRRSESRARRRRSPSRGRRRRSRSSASERRRRRRDSRSPSRRRRYRSPSRSPSRRRRYRSPSRSPSGGEWRSRSPLRRLSASPQRSPLRPSNAKRKRKRSSSLEQDADSGSESPAHGGSKQSKQKAKRRKKAAVDDGQLDDAPRKVKKGRKKEVPAEEASPIDAPPRPHKKRKKKRKPAEAAGSSDSAGASDEAAARVRKRTKRRTAGPPASETEESASEGGSLLVLPKRKRQHAGEQRERRRVVQDAGAPVRVVFTRRAGGVRRELVDDDGEDGLRG
eukprot:TRINITY_DN6735_c0_g1_i1.p1 TRINITY_DN6735_c0_g1~~TRINITY_DN6735_c0_g1_i1.p1  ORF type:complete len:1273 (+),score=266.96 TRINITY_DN6735_c0_g1_i1:51-3869(+)